jgi:hypothetical protein
VGQAQAPAETPLLDLPGQQQHRRRAGVRSRQPGAGVVHARAGDDERRARPPADAGVAVGHVRRGLLVPGGDEPDRRLAVQGVEELHELDARQPEDDLDPLGA